MKYWRVITNYNSHRNGSYKVSSVSSYRRRQCNLTYVYVCDDGCLKFGKNLERRITIECGRGKITTEPSQISTNSEPVMFPIATAQTIFVG